MFTRPITTPNFGPRKLKKNVNNLITFLFNILLVKGQIYVYST